MATEAGDDSAHGKELSRLMKLAQDGDGTAYRRLLSELLRLATAFVARRGFPTGENEDVVQEVLVAVHQKRHTYDPARPFLPWFYAIARYKIVDRWRSRGREETRASEIDLDLDNVAGSIGDGEGHLAAKDLEGMLSSLPDKQRDAIRLVKLDGLSVKEAAVRLGVSESDVKVSVHRGIKKLMENVRGGGPKT
jgi:RNA polymerase sigma-70 factor (ECF subfamily)